jgi:hypothetical protein
MSTFYLVCAIVGGTVMICQALLNLLGLGDHHGLGEHEVHTGDHHDVTHEQESSWFLSVLTFRAVVAALTFFGLAGLAAQARELEPGLGLGVALATGAGALVLVGTLMRSLHKLRADGTVRIDRAVGKSGTVYLTVPAQKAGLGKVTLNLQNRTVEYQAVTPECELATGTKVRVVSVVSADTVEVVGAIEVERAPHV